MIDVGRRRCRNLLLPTVEPFGLARFATSIRRRAAVNAPARHVRFKQADVKRAFAGALAAGVNVKVTIDPRGNIVIVPINDAAAEAGDETWADFK